jgi:hypothetical protein
VTIGVGDGALAELSRDEPVITSASDGKTCTAKIAKKAAAATRLTKIERRELMR